MSDYSKLRAKEIDFTRGMIQEHQKRLKWSRKELEAFQLQELKKLLKYVYENSKYYKKIIDDINLDIDNFVLSDLKKFPIMNKEILMNNWDDIVCDKNLSLDIINDYLKNLHGPSYLYDKYHAYTSGGTSGVRGVFAWDFNGLANFVNAFYRYQIRDITAEEKKLKKPICAVMVAEKYLHITPELFSVPMLYDDMEVIQIPVTIDNITKIKMLNDLQPTHLTGYSTEIYSLATFAKKGDLNIKPLRVRVNSEPLFPEMRELIKDVWPVPLNVNYGSTDCGPHAVSCDYSNKYHLCEDSVILELVDNNSNEVKVGELSDKLYATSLINKTLPLIRYEITDRLQKDGEKCPCGAIYSTINSVEGRLDDEFIYGNIRVDPHIIRSELVREPSILEYQVYQIDNGINIDAITNNNFNDDLKKVLVKNIKLSLEKVGLSSPKVNIKKVEVLKRNKNTGKLKRFIPI